MKFNRMFRGLSLIAAVVLAQTWRSDHCWPRKPARLQILWLVESCPFVHENRIQLVKGIKHVIEQGKPLKIKLEHGMAFFGRKGIDTFEKMRSIQYGPWVAENDFEKATTAQVNATRSAYDGIAYGIIKEDLGWDWTDVTHELARAVVMLVASPDTSSADVNPPVPPGANFEADTLTPQDPDTTKYPTTTDLEWLLLDRPVTLIVDVLPTDSTNGFFWDTFRKQMEAKSMPVIVFNASNDLNVHTPVLRFMDNLNCDEGGLTVFRAIFWTFLAISISAVAFTIIILATSCGKNNQDHLMKFKAHQIRMQNVFHQSVAAFDPAILTRKACEKSAPSQAPSDYGGCCHR